MRGSSEASFRFLPKFKEDPELKQYYKDINAAKELLEEHGENVRNGAKFGITALRVLDIIENIISISDITYFWMPLIAIPCYLISRLWSWGFRAGRESLIKDYAEKVISRYNEIISKTDDEEVKQKLIENRDKIKDRLNRDFD